MKTLTKILLILTVFLIVFACQKIEVNKKQNNQGRLKNAENSEISYDLITVDNGILVFESQEDFETILAQLEEAQMNWVTEFNETYGYLSEEEFNYFADSLGYFEDQPLVEFEEVLGFTSLRSVIQEALNEWLETGDTNWENNPDHHFIFDPFFRTLLNPDLAIKIEGIIYFIQGPTSCYEITDGKISTLNGLKNYLSKNESANYESSLPENVSYFNAELFSSTCKASKNFGPDLWIYYDQYNNKYLLEGSGGFINLPFYHKIHSLSKTYKWVTNKYKDYKTTIRTAFAGYVHPGTDCGSAEEPVAGFDYPDKLKSRAYASAFANGPFRVESGRIYSAHYTDPNNNYHTLLWEW